METFNKTQVLAKNAVRWLLYGTTFLFSLLSLVSTAFPALILRMIGGFEDNAGINPFEAGFYFVPLITLNLALLCFGILYHKHKIPKSLKKSIKFIFNFEISAGITFLIITILIGFYLVFTVHELFNGEYFPDYYIRVQEWVENYDPMVIGEYGLGKHFGIFFDWAGLQISGTDKTSPLIGSVFLLIMTYLVTAQIAKKRFAGILAMLIMTFSGLFRFYDTSVEYPNYWIAFYLLSIYLLFKKWPFSPISYIFSVMSKGLSAMFLPCTVFFIYNMNISKNKKLKLFSTYGIITIIGIVVLLGGINLESRNTPFSEFKYHDFWGGFGELNAALRNDPLVLFFLPSLLVGLFFVSKKGVIHADSITFMILVMLIHSALLAGFSDHHNIMYRMVPIISFFAIGVGLIFSKSPTAQSSQS